MGVFGYVGCPESGKSTLALKHASGMPRLGVLDLGAARTFMEWTPRAETCADMMRLLKEGHRPVWTPDDPNEVTELVVWLDKRFRCGVSLLFDEAYYVWSPHYTVKGVGSWLRRTQHHGGHGFYTTQRYGDLSGDAHGTTSVLYVFRCTAPRDLARLQSEKGLNPEMVKTLPQWHSIQIKGGF